MKFPPFHSTVPRLAALLLFAASVATSSTSAAEISATHVVFQKATKMKKADTFLYLPLVDQSRKADSATADRLVDCRVFAESSRGPLTVKGNFSLRLLGEDKGSEASWRSSVITAPVDSDGRGTFGSAAIADLVGQAGSAGAEARLMRIEFDGGKGKKVTRLTLDCANLEGES